MHDHNSKILKKILDYCLLLIRVFFPNNMTTIAISAWIPTIPAPNFYWKNSQKTETNCVCCSVKHNGPMTLFLIYSGWFI